LAGAELGSVLGQHHLPRLERRALFNQPAPGRWHVALLLREWTLAQGYATRDYRNFDVVFEQAAPEKAAAREPLQPPAASPRMADKLRLIKPAEPVATAAPLVTEASAAPAEPVATSVAAAVPVATSVAAAEPVAASVAAAVTAAEPAVVPAPAATSAAEPAVVSGSAAAVQPGQAAASNTTGLLCVHTATVEELSKLPGLSLKIAKEIVKSRPFASLEALLDVRGIGEKTLRRIKGLIRL
jgi:DNA uptake protein ComE-like DNA-binding protein